MKLIIELKESTTISRLDELQRALMLHYEDVIEEMRLKAKTEPD